MQRICRRTTTRVSRWASIRLVVFTLIALASGHVNAQTNGGPAFISTSGERVFPAVSTAVTFQTLQGAKGLGIEIATPSVIYGRVAARLGFSRNFVQGLNSDAVLTNPQATLEYYRFNVVSPAILVPFTTGLEGMTTYLGGGPNLVIPASTVSGSSGQLTFGVFLGVNIRVIEQQTLKKWGSLFEFGYNSENVDADKLVGKPQIADGFWARAGIRYFFL